MGGQFFNGERENARHAHDGFIGGGQIGYNWRVSESFVAGMEADIQGIASSRTAGPARAFFPRQRPASTS